MTYFLDQLTLPENLYWAWQKAKSMYHPSDGWYDEIRLAEFDANIDRELQGIAQNFLSRSYRLEPLKVTLRPKGGGRQRSKDARQYFWVDVRDQVAWLAFVNVIGPWLDHAMPAWSYGNRLYRSAWIDEANKEIVRVGRYRHASRRLYRKWSQGWPLYRRHIYLTLSKMARGGSRLPLDEVETRILQSEENLSEDKRLLYLAPGYWKNRQAQAVHWACIDLEKFYPKLSKHTVLQAISSFENYDPSFDRDEIVDIARALFEFEVDYSDLTPNEVKIAGLNPRSDQYHNLPTGLFVSGFLANVGMLRVDQVIEKELDKDKRIAHFRFVDDHTILASSDAALVDWISNYRTVLKTQGVDAPINPTKVEPPALAKYLACLEETPQVDEDKRRRYLRQLKEETRLDSAFPSPLMTRTLAKISDVAHAAFDTLGRDGQKQLLRDAEHLLLADFPEHELRSNTRVSFAAKILATVGPRLTSWSEEAANLSREINHREHSIRSMEQKAAEQSLPVRDKKQLLEMIRNYKDNHSELCARRNEITDQLEREQLRQRNHCFRLLLKAAQDRPDQLRMWMRLLQYTRATGCVKLELLFKKVQQSGTKETSSYFRAYILQVVSQQIIYATNDVLKEETLSNIRANAMKFLSGLRLQHEYFTVPRRKLRFYEQASVDLLRCAVGTSLYLLQDKQSDIEEVIDVVKSIKYLAKKIGAIDWNRNTREWAIRSGVALPILAWWSELQTNPIDSSSPGKIWQIAANKIHSDDNGAWPFWQRHPSKLPTKALNDLVAGEVSISKTNFGWVYDAISKQSSIGSNELRSIKGDQVIRTISSAIQPHSTNMRLDEWTDWVHKNFSVRPHDPRVGEWTAIEIIRQIADQLSVFGNEDLEVRKAIHPANFTIPRSWSTDELGVLTWEEWRSRAPKRNRIGYRRKHLIYDQRFTPGLESNSLFASDLAAVHGLAMLLLGLLRKSFEWPAAWNPPLQFQAWSWLIHGEIRKLNCSSWTEAILKGCLLPRQWETLILRSWDQPDGSSEDIAKDPPLIFSIATLNLYLSKAQEVLRTYQLTVQNHEPRQLIPISLISRNQASWENEVSSEQTGEDTP